MDKDRVGSNASHQFDEALKHDQAPGQPRAGVTVATQTERTAEVFAIRQPRVVLRNTKIDWERGEGGTQENQDSCKMERKEEAPDGRSITRSPNDQEYEGKDEGLMEVGSEEGGEAMEEGELICRAENREGTRIRQLTVRLQNIGSPEEEVEKRTEREEAMDDKVGREKQTGGEGPGGTGEEGQNKGKRTKEKVFADRHQKETLLGIFEKEEYLSRKRRREVAEEVEMEEEWIKGWWKERRKKVRGNTGELKGRVAKHKGKEKEGKAPETKGEGNEGEEPEGKHDVEETGTRKMKAREGGAKVVRVLGSRKTCPHCTKTLDRTDRIIGHMRSEHQDSPLLLPHVSVAHLKDYLRRAVAVRQAPQDLPPGPSCLSPPVQLFIEEDNDEPDMEAENGDPVDDEGDPLAE